ncbi:MAG: helix-turn-helix domain-containing protein [archaeon]
MELPENIEDLEVWSKYGLKESPYTTSPMRLLGTLPFDVFCGRGEEIEKLLKIILSSNSTRTLIVGDFGIGKTTYANYVRWLLCMKKDNSKYLTTSIEIKVQPDWDAVKFLFATLSAVYTSSIVFDWNGKGIKLKAISELKEYIVISKEKNIQANLLGVGGGYGVTKTNPVELSPELLEGLLTNICKEMKEHNKELILQYNNLENMNITTDLARLFKTIREYVQIEGLHTLFLGPPFVIAALETHGEVHSVFSQPIVLEPLTEENVLEILERRCASLKLENGKYIPPYDKETVKEIYKHLNNIRFTFKVLEDATILSGTSAPCKLTMTEIKVIHEQEKKHIFSTLTASQSKIISALLAHDKLQLKELSKVTGIGSTNLTTPVEQLRLKGLILIDPLKEDKRYKLIRLSDNTHLRLSFAPLEIK